MTGSSRSPPDKSNVRAESLVPENPGGIECKVLNIGAPPHLGTRQQKLSHAIVGAPGNGAALVMLKAQQRMEAMQTSCTGQTRFVNVSIIDRRGRLRSYFYNSRNTVDARDHMCDRPTDENRRRG